MDRVASERVRRQRRAGRACPFMSTPPHTTQNPLHQHTGSPQRRRSSRCASLPRTAYQTCRGSSGAPRVSAPPPPASPAPAAPRPVPADATAEVRCVVGGCDVLRARCGTRQPVVHDLQPPLPHNTRRRPGARRVAPPRCRLTISTPAAGAASQRARRPPRCWPSWYASAAVAAPAAATVDDARQARRKFMGPVAMHVGNRF